MLKKITILLLLLFVLPSLANADNLSTRLQGKILLQVEKNGEAWYVYPKNENRYFLGRPADAFQVMRELGLGISNSDFSKYENAMPERLLGFILIKVEDSGRAYYINPEDKQAHFLGRPADAFRVMREQGLGITTASLETINEDPSSEARQSNAGSEPPVIEDDDDTEDSEAQNTEDDTATEEEPEEVIPEEDETASSSDDVATSSEETVATSTEETIVEAEGSENCEFLAEYFRKQEISGIAPFIETVNGINENWGSEAPAGLDYTANKFSVRFTGDCYFEEGTYEFTTIYDDGVRATIDNLWIVKDWDDNKKVVEASTELRIEEGSHRIKVEYFDYLENAQVSLDWKKISD